MGRESTAVCHWDGKSAETKVLLESTEIILRGELRAKIPRASISKTQVKGDTLVVTTGKQELRLELGKVEAEKWYAVLSKPPPSLAQKLGVDLMRRAFVLGETDDKELARALKNNTTADVKVASILIAIVQTEAHLTAAIKTAKKRPECPIWCVYGKGKFTTVTDSAIRSAMRAAGFADTKTSGVSAQLTATRYQMKKVE
jgi:hypothetical protein